LQGRIRLFSVEDNRLTLVAYAETRGAVYSIANLGKSLIAGINSRIQLYEWNKIETSLDPVCGHSGHTIVLQIDVLGDLILVGDLMKSVQLYKYQKASNSIDLLARDFNPAWIASSVILDKDVFLGADSCYNLFTLKRNVTAETDEDKCRLNVIGQYHLGDFVNRFRPGSLVMKLPDSEISKIPTMLFGTINGALGIVASLSVEQYQCLEELQNVLRHHIKGVGGLDHAEWRSFQTAFLREDTECTGYIDGDLLEQILDLSHQDQEEILGKLGGGEKADRVMRLVEDLSRLH
jgi:DNA damage-binding protein 1